MIIVMKMNATETDVQRVADRIIELGLRTHLSQGEERTIIGVIGDNRPVNREMFERMEGVEKVMRVLPPFKLASRDFKPDDTVIPLNGTRIGDRQVVVMAGPCAVEDRVQMREVAHAVKEAGVKILRGGAFKPRTSPYSFQGLGRKGLEILAEVRDEFGLAIVTEVMAPEDVPLVAEYADILQVGARNMQNYALLHALGANGKPVLLKRGMMSTLQELLMSAEYILSHGNYQVMLCERGIRTFEPYTRNTFDINAIPALKGLTHLPVIADPSHGTGKWDLVAAVSKAAVAAGADGLIIEVHPHPSRALSDGAQSLKPETFARLMVELQAVAQAVGREL
ncbi:MAG: 3-deoxy-7-phosphoheptulonate synthase [Anaerolineales bacterium]|nr:MAG: 3-deoxy-7-phosphoheptulonate synthase [Anaerolineales bacterium]